MIHASAARDQARPRRRGARALAVILGLALGLGALELVIRALAPLPELTRDERFHREIALPDRARLYRLRPGARSDWSRYSERDDRSVPFSIDEHGRRAREFDSGGSGAELRVACLGDSTTMGFGVGDEEHFAYRLGGLLARRHPERRVRVLNFGTHGYTSAQGRAQFEEEVVELRPELVILAYGYNDADPSAVDERSLAAAQPPRVWAPLHELGDSHSATYHLMWKLAHPLRQRPAAGTRVTREAFAENLRAIAGRARDLGARVVLVDSCVPHSFLRAVTAELARELGAPYLCLRELFERAARSRGLETFPESARGSDSLTTLRARWRGDRPAALLLIDRDDPSRLPRLFPLRDDGTLGDELAGDGIQTFATPLVPTRATLEWTIVDRANIEAHPLAAAYAFYRLLELEPRQGYETPVLGTELWLRGIGDYLRAYVSDLGHPNAAGHAEIAQALDELIARADG
jgi:lysophospholipase L1-like esterase